ncbi:MAG: YwaF family protein [Bacilli bacterium]|nr:YwaF family protein [Bacilli bacterium]
MMFFEKYKKLFLKTSGVLLGIIYFFLLLVHDAFDSNNFETIQQIVPDSTTRILITILRAFTSGSILIAILSCFYSPHYLSRAARYFSPTICLLNIIFCRINFVCYLGNSYTKELLVLRIVFFVLENLLILSISFLNWFEFIKSGIGGKKSPKKVVLTGIFILCVTILCSPITTLFSLNGGYIGFNSREFNFCHILILIFTVAFPLGITFLFRRRSINERWFICSFLSLALLYSYFSRYDFQTYQTLFSDIKEHKLAIRMDVLPLHLCNFGIILSFIAIAFKCKKIYYFNFFGNFFGYLLGIILPNIKSDFLRPTTIHYWQNHIYGITLAILGLSLALFPRPTKKDLKNSLLIFLCYFLVVVLIDVWFSYDWENNDGCDIFFLNSSMYADILHIGFVRENPFIIKMTDSFGIEHRIYYLYWTIIYVVFSLLMTVIYFATIPVYKIVDHYNKRAEA